MPIVWAVVLLFDAVALCVSLMQVDCIWIQCSRFSICRLGFALVAVVGALWLLPK